MKILIRTNKGLRFIDPSTVVAVITSEITPRDKVLLTDSGPVLVKNKTVDFIVAEIPDLIKISRREAVAASRVTLVSNRKVYLDFKSPVCSKIQYLKASELGYMNFKKAISEKLKTPC